MFDKGAKDMFDIELESAKNWAPACNHHAETDMARAEGMALYALSNGDIRRQEFDLMISRIQSIRLNRKAKDADTSRRDTQLRRAS
ncbi:hypothetical protein HX823_00605 [Pseudomonas sp. P7759]|uniref:hypothetical protein n=1 Tax=Pseudomonas sp. P7759 TaxID=2738831 RepID=UPI0015A2CDC3|nr:hypothetical protein [Pseudomonas sp. P7759]NWC72571.1 hypothetical protein [Pseudomonas sp. P7759]